LAKREFEKGGGRKKKNIDGLAAKAGEGVKVVVGRKKERERGPAQRCHLGPRESETRRNSRNPDFCVGGPLGGKKRKRKRDISVAVWKKGEGEKTSAPEA